jgi:hypothetical protein
MKWLKWFIKSTPGVSQEAVDEDQAVGEAQSAVNELNGFVEKLEEKIKYRRKFVENSSKIRRKFVEKLEKKIK